MGNGCSIKIWKDRWLSNPSVLEPTTTVSELLEENTKWWNSLLVESIFSPEEAQLIVFTAQQ